MTRKDIVYFNPPYVNLGALKKDYKRLAMKYHPDVGGSEDAMKQINNEYEYLFEHLDGYIFDGETDSAETPHDLIDIMDKLIKIPEIIIEICGSWIWVSGNTYNVKNELKAAGCKWAAKRYIVTIGQL